MKSMLLKSVRVSLLMIIAAVGFAGVANAATTTQLIAYSWSIPTTRADSTALPVAELAGYTIYYSVDGGAEQKLAVTLGTTTTKTLSLALAAKAAGYTLVASVTATDTDGLESARSNVVTTKLTVTNALPAPPTNLKLSVTCANGSCSMVVQ